MRKKIGWILYSVFAKYLPASASSIKLGQAKIRAWCVKSFIKKCGHNVNIERNAFISPEVSIGNNSGIGKNAYIGITVTIGDDVMMGPDCLI